MGEHVELLAPAGNYDAFLGAVNAGADAVYLGGERFGARAYADNFRAEEILRALHVAHFYGKKIYLTVNTLLKQREIQALSDYLAPLCEEGLDGVIVQDLGALRFMKEHFPALSLHASTQMTVTGVRGASLLKEAGVSRIVPARELSLREVQKIRTEAGVEVECFIHGAMCYSYSGQCLFSSILGGRSGNRGRCAQPCRLPYEIWEGKRRLAGESYPLSLKDMCTLQYLPSLIGAGIDSFKIEGRMKRPEYTAGVTAIYRKYIDRYYEEGARYQVEEADLNTLKRLYIRSEIQTGYYERHNGKEMITLEKPGYEGCDEALLDEIREAYIREPEKMPVRLKALVSVNEPLRIKIEKDTGMRDALSGKMEQTLGDFWRETVKSAEFLTEIAGETVQPAKNAPLTEEDIRKRLTRMGESLLTVTACEIKMQGAGFVPVRALNELRREAVASFENAVCEARAVRSVDDGEESAAGAAKGAASLYEDEFRKDIKYNRLSQSMSQRPVNQTSAGEDTPANREHITPANRKIITPAIHALVATIEQLYAALSCECERIYIESDLFLREGDEVLAALKPSCVFYLALPHILRERDDAYLRRLTDALRESAGFASLRGFLVRSLEGLSFARELSVEACPKEDAYSLVADAGLYCFNAETAAFLADYVDEITLPYELNAAEAAHLTRAAQRNGAAVTLIIYSHIPMMITANCLAKTADACRKWEGKDGAADGHLVENGQIFLKDRKEVSFPVVLNCEHCYNILYNAVPYSLHTAQRERERIGASACRYDFTTETGEVCEKILRGTYVFADYTAGHCKRGVE